MGYVDSKNLIYNNLDIVINFSTIPESFSFATIEAMAYKKVIIAADIGGPAEIIDNKYNGFLVEAGNSPLLKETVCYCIDNFHSAEFNEIRNNARKTIEDKYSFINFASSYEVLFNQLSANNP
jgi:glycosyltransferase involved in cell wall biosynthesis